MKVMQDRQISWWFGNIEAPQIDSKVKIPKAKPLHMIW